MSRVLLTGASGFLGSALVPALLERGYRVTVLLRGNPSWPARLPVNQVRGDLLDPASLEAGLEGCSLVVHAAGVVSYRRGDAGLLEDVHVRGTENLCRAALHRGVQRLVHVSSTAAIGIGERPSKPADETLRFDRRWDRLPYMRTKRLGEEAALGFLGQGLPVVVVNPSTLYGPGDVKLHSGEVFRNIASGRLRVAPPGGNGVVAVEDCAAGVLAALERGRPGERYILNAENLSFLEIFQVISGLLGRPPVTRSYPAWARVPFLLAAAFLEGLFGVFGRPSPIDSGTIAVAWRFRYYDSTKARRELGWAPRVPFGEACRRALEFYRERGLLPAPWSSA